MYTDAKRLVEPWNNNSSRSSSERALHHLSSRSTTMYSPTKRCFDYDHVYDPKQIPEACVDRVTSGVDRVNTLNDGTYTSDDYQKNLHPSFSLGQERGYYYDTHKSEPKTYNYNESKASVHSDVVVKVLRDPYLNHSTFGTTHDMPGVIESESSSLDSSFDYSDYMVSNTSSSKSNHEAEIMSRHYNGNRKEYTEGYGKFPAAKYNKKVSKSKRPDAGAIASYTPSYNWEVAGVTKSKMIEIAPGEFMRLRGAHETWKAIQNDFYLPCSCFCCDLTLFCIQDATYVLCPQCQVVNPLEKLMVTTVALDWGLLWRSLQSGRLIL